jgi:hypothetical protein
MPFVADTRCPYMRVNLNTSYIAELLEHLLEMDFSYDNDNSDKQFYGYVETIEDHFSCFYCRNPTISFVDWFIDNADNNIFYDDMVKYCFKKRD